MDFYERPTRADQALYDITRALCSGGLLVDRGTPYPCTQEDLDSYRRLPPGGNLFRAMHQREALGRLLDYLDPHRRPSPKEQSAMKRLLRGINMKRKAPDIVIRAFRDLDIVFFGENLSGNCIVWVSGISHAVLIFELLLHFGSRLEYTSFSEVFKH